MGETAVHHDGHQDQVRWLTPAQLRAWRRLEAVAELLPGALDQPLREQADLTHFDYIVLAQLSEAPGRVLRMSELARRTNATLPRLSHVAKRLEARGYLTRQPCAVDKRATNALLTEEGWQAVVAAAPVHVASVRALVIDQLSAAQLGQLDEIAARLLAVLDPDGVFAD